MLPTKPLHRFPFIVFGKHNHTTGMAHEGWGTYCKGLHDFLPVVRKKEDLPLIYHGMTVGNAKTKGALRTLGAVVVDCDSARRGRPVALLEALRADGCAYVYQERLVPRGDFAVMKYHLVIPLAEPITVPQGVKDPGVAVFYRAQRRLRAFRVWLERVAGEEFDPSFDRRPSQGLYPYCVRDGVVPYHEASPGPGASLSGLDLEGWMLQEGVEFDTPLRPRRPDPVDMAKVAVLQDLIIGEMPAEAGYEDPDNDGDGGRASRGWYIRCPNGPHEGNHTKTILTKSGRVVCLAARCAGKDTLDFVAALDDKRRAAVRAAEEAARKAAQDAEWAKSGRKMIPLEDVPGAIRAELEGV